MEFCHSFGAGISLAAIETFEENESIKDWLEDNGDPSTGVWIAGSDNGHHGVWAWFSTGQLIRRGDWGVGQPRGGDHHCLYLVGGGVGGVGYQWADFHCDFQMTFLCEINARTNVEKSDNNENEIDFIQENSIVDFGLQKLDIEDESEKLEIINT